MVEDAWISESDYLDQDRHGFYHHNGTTALEILVLGAPVHSSLLLLTALALWRGATFTSPLGACFELLLLCAPPLLSLTSLSSAPELLLLPLTGLGAAVLVLASRNRAKTPPSPLPCPPQRVPYITNYRSSMMLITTICILAVDFPVFPRRLAKTETFGFGLMDLGVGSFVFSNGLVSAEARGLEQGFVSKLRSVWPLLVLGSVRLAAVSLSGYHTNVTEYGVHWNFFFTLAAVRLLSAPFGPLLRSGRSGWLLAVCCSVLYEGLLSYPPWGLQEWLLGDSPRVGIIEANREGLLSSLGYLPLYLAGVSWGRDLILLSLTPSDLITSAGLLLVWSLLMWANLSYSATLFSPPSRRLANYTFFTWTLAYNLTLLAGFALLDLLLVYVAQQQDAAKKTSRNSKAKKDPRYDTLRTKLLRKPSGLSPICPDLYRSPCLYRAVSYNSLPFFLAANLCTGAVNLCVATVKTGDWAALALLGLYLGLLSVGAMVAWRRGVSLKCW